MSHAGASSWKCWNWALNCCIVLPSVSDWAGSSEVRAPTSAFTLSPRPENLSFDLWAGASWSSSFIMVFFVSAFAWAIFSVRCFVFSTSFLAVVTFLFSGTGATAVRFGVFISAYPGMN